ncbi:hypothetical protein S245_036585, partial [Arachis hypogaea]
IVTDNAPICKVVGLLIKAEFSSITQITEDASFIKNFIVNHHMRLYIFNEFNTLKLVKVAPIQFVSTIVMLKKFRLLKQGLKQIVINNIGKAEFVTEKILSKNWWQKIDYILTFTTLIYDILRSTDMNAPTLCLVHEMCDSMIKKVERAIYLYERKDEQESSFFYNVANSILVQKWTKSITPLHCLAHSLYPREDPTRVSSYQDIDITNERVKYLK